MAKIESDMILFLLQDMTGQKYEMRSTREEEHIRRIIWQEIPEPMIIIEAKNEAPTKLKGKDAEDWIDCLAKARQERLEN